MSPAPVTRHLGKGGPQVNAIGFGLMGLSYAYGKPLPDEERFKILDHALKIGETFWDSAELYGDNEELLGKWFARTGKRDQIFLATKFAAKVIDGKLQMSNSAEYIHQAVKTSLKNLKTDHIDLWYCHRLTGDRPVEDIVSDMAEHVKSGEVRYLGLSECSAETLRRACKVHHIAAVQIEYSPFTLDIEHSNIGLLAAARELGVAVVAYSPLSRGFLTGELRSADDIQEGDFRKNAPRFSKENFPKNLAVVDRISEIAKAKNATAGQVTLAWLLAQGDDIIPIPGTTKIARLEENFGAQNVTLSDGEVKELRKIIDGADIQGTRYPGGMMQTLFKDTPEKK